MRFKIFQLLFILCIIKTGDFLSAQDTGKGELTDTIIFVSFPDFFNFDVPNPWPKWDTAINYFLSEVKSENPDFVLVAGDLVDGRWWDSPQCIEHAGTVYYSGWVERMNQHALKYYTAVGDHELGDDPWPEKKIKLIPYFEKTYSNILKMPSNGPDNKKGLAYYVRQGDLLLITVETFEVINDSMHTDVRGEQLSWFREVLRENKDAKFKVVQGHIPVWGEINYRSSSRLMLDNGKSSEFYKAMIKNDVDLYLCGEFHDITVLESDGLWQIVHGSSWGRKIVNTQDYLVCRIEGNNMYLFMKRIYMDATGDYMWNINKERGPRERMVINEKSVVNGPETVGTITIYKTKDRKDYLNMTGIFNYENQSFTDKLSNTVSIR
jgi:hypothetical protein